MLIKLGIHKVKPFCVNLCESKSTPNSLVPLNDRVGQTASLTWLKSML